MNLDSSTRLNKFISDSGYCSRREADKLIETSRVRINGKLPELGSKVGAGDEVTIDDMQIFGSAPNKTDRIYLAYNKPIGITCTTEQAIKGNIVDAIDHDERIFPIGRLDKSSDGLILLTNDGDIVNKILRAENSHDKEYLVSVNKSLDGQFANNMASGVPILGTKTKPCKVNIINKTTFKITLTEGLNRQIRRMCAHFGYDVKSLTRLRIMNIQLGGLRTGQWRKLSQTELEQLSAAVSQSSSETRKTTRRRKKPSPNYQGKNAYLAAGQNKREQVVTEKTDPNSTRKKRPAKNAPKGAGKTAARPTAKGKPSARAKPPSKPLRAATRPSKRQK